MLTFWSRTPKVPKIAPQSWFLDYYAFWGVFGCRQRWKKRGTRGTPSVLIFSSCAIFLDFYTILRTISRIFAHFCCDFAHLEYLCTSLHFLAEFCAFMRIFAHVFVLILCQCYFSRFFQLWLPVSWTAFKVTSTTKIGRVHYYLNISLTWKNNSNWNDHKIYMVDHI